MKSCIAACFWGESTLPRDQCQSPESPGLAWAGQKVLNPRAPGAELPVLPHLPSCAPLDGPLGCSLLLLPLRRPTWPHAAFTSHARGKNSFHHQAASTHGTGTAARPPAGTLLSALISAGIGAIWLTASSSALNHTQLTWCFS